METTAKNAKSPKTWHQFKFSFNEVVVLKGLYQQYDKNYKGRLYRWNFSTEDLAGQFRLLTDWPSLGYFRFERDFRTLLVLGELIIQSLGLQEIKSNFYLDLSERRQEIKRRPLQLPRINQELEVEENGLPFLKGRYAKTGAGQKVFIHTTELVRLVQSVTDQSDRWICLGGIEYLEALLTFFRAFRQARCYKVLVAKPVVWQGQEIRFEPIFKIGSMAT